MLGYFGLSFMFWDTLVCRMRDTGPSQVRVRSASDTAPEPSRPSKKRKLRKIASEAGSSAPELGQAEDVDEANLTDFCAEIENSLERDEGTSTRATSAPTPRLGKRLVAPPSVANVSVAVSSHAGKSRAEVIRHQIDPLDSLACSALARNVEYDQISEDDFGTATHATRGEEIDLTLFPLTHGPYQMSYPY
ncbi:hypothetical protein Tco_1488028, partial [Tanacetum coccineum]